MQRIIAVVLAAGACASSLQAQTSLPATAETVLTLAQALEGAGATSPASEAARAAIRAAEAQRRVAGLRPNPSLVAETENVAGTGIYSGVRSAETTIGLALPIERGGKRGARVAVARAQVDRAVIEAVVVRADLRLRVTRSYIEAAAARRRAMVAREQVDIAAEALRGARVRVRAGRASPLEQQRADVARIMAEGAAERAERTAVVTAGNLARLIGREAGALDLEWFDRIVGIGADADVDVAGTLAAAATSADVAIVGAQVRLAQSQRVPDLTLTASARRLEQTKDTAAVFGISLPLPVFNAGRSAVHLATAQRQQVNAQRRLVLLDAAQAIAEARAEAANAATAARNAAGPALLAAQEAARIARIGYREGKFGQIDLLDAERTLSELRQAALAALVAHHDAQARLERLTTPTPLAQDDFR